MVPFAMVIKETGSSKLKQFRGVPPEDAHNIQTHLGSLDLLVSLVPPRTSRQPPPPPHFREESCAQCMRLCVLGGPARRQLLDCSVLVPPRPPQSKARGELCPRTFFPSRSSRCFSPTGQSPGEESHAV